MHYRTLGKTGWKISEISLGTWQVGGKWGSPFDEKLADQILNEAIDQGVNFIDTADVYSGGESERAVGRLVRNRSERIYVATKCGRRLNPHTAEGYTPENITKFIENSLSNTGLEAIDLIQLHCPPTAVYEQAALFDALDTLTDQGKILHYGVSVETVDEAIRALAYPNLASVQIIFNLFRHKPADQFFALAREAKVGVITRVPLASGLLTGKFDKDTIFDSGDHRNFNRQGEYFDKGETFSGVNYDVGLAGVSEYLRLFGRKFLTQYALKWILMHPEVSCVIPGASNISHVQQNVAASEIPPLPDMAMQDVEEVYEKYIKQYVHHLW
ncbi:MAG: aldo/keto reductase [Bacteroidota bacterium]